MLVPEDERLLDELRRVLNIVDPVPMHAKLAARDALRDRLARPEIREFVGRPRKC